MAESGLPFHPRQLELLQKHDPNAFATAIKLLDYQNLEWERELYEGSLFEFFKRAWREIEAKKLELNWHQEVICETLQAITLGESRSRDVVINIPFRHSKSTLVNIVWPAWTWCRAERLPLSGAHVSFLSVSYASRLAESNATKMLWLVQGHWYQTLWGDRVQIRGDQQSRTDFGNTGGGSRYSASVEAGLIGRGGDVQIVDDPHSVEGAESDAQRAATMQAFTESLPSRVTDPRISARVLIMQRLHEQDCTNWALENWDNPVHLMFPGYFDPDRACEGDPRTQRDEILWPSVWSDAAFKRLKLSRYAFAGQIQQMPTPRGGGIFKREWFQPWPPLEQDGTRLMEGWVGYDKLGRRTIKYPALEYVCASVDTAFTQKEENDYCAMLVLGIWRAEGKGRIERRGDQYVRVPDDVGFPKVLVLNGWMKRLALHGPPEEIPYGVSREQWNSPLYLDRRSEKWGLVEWTHYTCKRYKVDALDIETQARGHDLKDELYRLHQTPDYGIDLVPAKQDKYARARAVEHLVSNGQVYVPMFEDGTHPQWLTPLIEQICRYPKTEHDDVVDTFSMGLKHLRERGLLERKQEYDQEEEELSLYEKIRPNIELPYPMLSGR